MTLYLHLCRLLKMSNMAAYDWSSSTDLHLWYKCQESSPMLKCTVVIQLSDWLVWLQEGAEVVMYPTAAYPAPTLLPGHGGGSAGGIQGPQQSFFLPIRTLCTKALKQPPLWHDDNVQFHTASWRLTVYYVCIIFLKNGDLGFFNYCAISVIWEDSSKSILL